MIGKGRLHSFNYGLYWPLWDVICGTRYRDLPETTVATKEGEKFKSTWSTMGLSRWQWMSMTYMHRYHTFSYPDVCSDHCHYPFLFNFSFVLAPSVPDCPSLEINFHRFFFRLVRSFFFSSSTRRWQKIQFACERKERQTKRERENSTKTKRRRVNKARTRPKERNKRRRRRRTTTVLARSKRAKKENQLVPEIGDEQKRIKATNSSLWRKQTKAEKENKNRVVHFCVLQSNTTSNSEEIPNEDLVDAADKVTLIYCYQKVRYSSWRIAIAWAMGLTTVNERRRRQKRLKECIHVHVYVLKKWRTNPGETTTIKQPVRKFAQRDFHRVSDVWQEDETES